MVVPQRAIERLIHDQSHGVILAACKRARITYTTPDGMRQPGWHDLRCEFACWARRKGMADETVMEIAGWNGHAVVLRYLRAAEADGVICTHMLQARASNCGFRNF